MRDRLRLYLLGLVTALAILLAVALPLWQPWSSGEDKASPAVPGVERNTSSSTGPQDAELSGLLATTDLSVGANRVSFLLVSPDALITIPEASVTSLYLPTDGSPPVVKENAIASFHLWPYGTRGNYATQFTFDKPGDWALDIRVEDGDGFADTLRIPLKVKETSTTPAIGSRPPLTPTKTLRDVDSLNQLTGGSSPDRELYQQTIAEALGSHRPLLVVFSSPAFCSSPTCGPQVETVRQLKERYKDQSSFIHVEVYDNPHEIQGDLDRGRYAPAVEAWGLTQIEGYLNESWTFILDREGRISAKFEGFATEEELEDSLLQVLQTPSS